MARKPYATSLKPDTIDLVRKIQRVDDKDPTVPQVLHAAVKAYAEKQGIAAESAV